VLVRKDLSPSQQAVQAAHAAIEVARKHISSDEEHPHLVIAGVSSEVHLQNAYSRLKAHGVTVEPFYEADIGDELTAIASAPISGKDRHHFRRFNLINLAEPVCDLKEVEL
jgi:peptidyl-tRNA hydrolase